MKAGITKESQDSKGAGILVPARLTTKKLHDAIELYMAGERQKGRKIKTKPAAVVELLTKQLGIASQS